MRLVAFSGATCLTRKPIGAILAHPESLAFLQALLGENLAVAAAVGQGLPADAAEVAMAFFRALPAEAKSSMLVDLEAGRPLEMPWLAGRMSELARSHGVPAPANTAVVAALAPHAAGANSAP